MFRRVYSFLMRPSENEGRILERVNPEQPQAVEGSDVRRTESKDLLVERLSANTPSRKPKSRLFVSLRVTTLLSFCLPRFS